MAKLILFNKPFDVLCQFTDSGTADGQPRKTLADFLDAPECRNCYPAGRLDRDSEGLLLLTDSGPLQQQIAHPRFKLPKTYWVQVEGEPTEAALDQLRRGVELQDGLTRPAEAALMAAPELWPRTPPIRFRANVSTSWLELTIREGRNRQVRRMTAAVGFPTLRLVRVQIGPWRLQDLESGSYRLEQVHAPVKQRNKPQARRHRR